MRTDCSATGAPKFSAFEDETALFPKGKPVMNQQIAAIAPRSLAKGTCYFVAGSVGKVSLCRHAVRLYINGELVAEQERDETLHYATEARWTTIGADDRGGWQNWDGLIDNMRIYNRPLTRAQLQALAARLAQ